MKDQKYPKSEKIKSSFGMVCGRSCRSRGNTENVLSIAITGINLLSENTPGNYTIQDFVKIHWIQENQRHEFWETSNVGWREGFCNSVLTVFNFF